MKTVKLPKLLMTVLSATSGCLTKMEIVLIFVLSITSCYAVKMEMLIAETQPLTSPVTLIEKAVVERDSGSVKGAIVMLENSYSELAYHNMQSFIALTETAD